MNIHWKSKSNIIKNQKRSLFTLPQIQPHSIVPYYKTVAWSCWYFFGFLIDWIRWGFINSAWRILKKFYCQISQFSLTEMKAARPEKNPILFSPFRLKGGRSTSLWTEPIGCLHIAKVNFWPILWEWLHYPLSHATNILISRLSLLHSWSKEWVKKRWSST